MNSTQAHLAQARKFAASQKNPQMFCSTLNLCFPRVIWLPENEHIAPYPQSLASIFPNLSSNDNLMISA